MWRTVNLIACHDVLPEEIFLSPFTEKAAFQLKQGLNALLGLVTNLTGKPYDIAEMYIGTVHCYRTLLEAMRFQRKTLVCFRKICVKIAEDER